MRWDRLVCPARDRKRNPIRVSGGVIGFGTQTNSLSLCRGRAAARHFRGARELELDAGRTRGIDDEIVIIVVDARLHVFRRFRAMITMNSSPEMRSAPRNSRRKRILSPGRRPALAALRNSRFCGTGGGEEVA